MFDTIAAISTGIVNQPISIIRISGPQAFAIVKKIFTGKRGEDKSITHGFIKDGSQAVDEVLVSWFKSPSTFTGEDIVEINAHGGVINSNRILELCLTHGARMAENGEFSRRAFLNGKIDLIKAEAIHDLIFAKTVVQSKFAIKKFDGQTSTYIENLKRDLLKVIATIETNIDYPEYDDVEILTTKNLLPKLNLIKNDLDEAIKLAIDSKYILEGLRVAIVGKPNSGKSTLLNALLNEDKAIVTSTPGTTRDIVEGEITINGLLMHIVDTAGIHHTEDLIEKKGIEKSREQISQADLIIHLVDPLEDEDSGDTKIHDYFLDKPYIKVFSKKDLKAKEGISISAKNNDIDALIIKIKKSVPQININNEKLIINVRQQALIKLAYEAVVNSIKSLQEGFQPDEVIIDVRNAWENLANITGKADNESLLDEMFKNFCLGK